MSTQIRNNTEYQSLFFYLLCLSAFFCLAEISFFIQGTKAYFNDFTVVASQLRIPAKILPHILLFIFIQLMIHVAYTFLIWLFSISIARLFHLNSNQTFYLGLTSWIVGILIILLANQYFYPNSRYAKLFPIVFSHDIQPRQAEENDSQKTYSSNTPSQAQPNIIIVGIDSLRPDFLTYFGGDASTPFLDDMLNKSTVFSEAITPLARTFPSWMSILTGEYPTESGVRFNLAKKNKTIFRKTLASIFRQQGYQTIYASDETRFSNIDKDYGFDQIISPPIGLNDFLLGSLNDFPLSNLLINTAIGKWLFPYSYANRGAFFSYNPNSFLQLLKPAFMQDRHKPIFLAIHFCLPHFPYVWAGMSAENLSPQQRYQASIERVDQQIADFFVMLNDHQRLNNAIVVLLSDHGEALALPGDRITEKENYITNSTRTAPLFYSPGLDSQQMNESAGHGTDVLGLSQYHTLLAFRLYGRGVQKEGAISGMVSLIDIKPSLLDLTHLSVPKDKTSGRSLSNIIIGHVSNTPVNRHLFIESDFSPQAIRTVYPQMRKVLLEGAHIFSIDPQSTRLQVKDDMASMIIKSKQYADIYQHWMLAYYPQGEQVYMPVLIDLESGQWTTDLKSRFAQQSPLKAMRTALKNHYHRELDSI